MQTDCRPNLRIHRLFMPFTDWQRTLLHWYESHRRELPWRGISDPYRIWVSEVILQQTRVAQGLEYYLRFVERFPDVEHLAAADEDEVLRLWQGLGYYSRARNMRKAARQIVERGGFPQTYKDVRALAGIGSYTAAAICSFAYGIPVAVVDGNVFRVLSRYWAISTPIDTASGKREFEKLADSLMCKACPGDYNQALMDFGALQCVPQSPDCGSCPLAARCAAYACGDVRRYPVKSRTTTVTTLYFVYVVVESSHGFWLRRREGHGIWQGLYEPPLLTFTHRPTDKEILEHPFLRQLACHATVAPVAGELRHQLTHRLIVARCLLARTPVHAPEEYKEVGRSALGDYAMPRLVEMVFQRGFSGASPLFGEANGVW